VSARALILVLSLAAAAAASAKDLAPCKGELSGAVKGTFRCAVEVRDGGDGVVTLGVTALEPVAGVQSLAPGGFQLPGPLKARTYTLADVVNGRVAVIAADGVLYSATRTTGTRGEATLALREVKRLAQPAGAWAVRGRLEARLKPSGSPRADEIVLVVEF